MATVGAIRPRPASLLFASRGETIAALRSVGGGMLKRSMLVLVVAAVCLLAAAPLASGKPAGGSCPAGWETWTIEEAVELKLALGYPLTREELLAAADALDQND